MSEHHDQADDSDQSYHRVHTPYELGNLRKQLQRGPFRTHAQCDRKLLGDDDHANRGEQPVHGGGREELPKNARSKTPEDDLNDPSRHADAKREPIGLHVRFRISPRGKAELCHAPQSR